MESKFDSRIRSNMTTFSMLSFILAIALTLLNAFIISHIKPNQFIIKFDQTKPSMKVIESIKKEIILETSNNNVSEMIQNGFLFTLLGFLVIVWSIRTFNHKDMQQYYLEIKYEKWWKKFWYRDWLLIIILILIFFILLAHRYNI